MDRTKILNENEWLAFLDHQMQAVEITKMEKRNLAQALAYHFMSIDDALKLTEERLIKKFHIRKRSLIEQIVEWQMTFANKPSSPASSYEDRPLVGLYETSSHTISDDEILEAIQTFQTTTDEHVENFTQSYNNFIDAIMNYGSNKYKNEERIWFRCRTCSHIVWVAKPMGAFTSFPACFNCQIESLTRTIQKTTSSSILEPPLD